MKFKVGDKVRYVGTTEESQGAMGVIVSAEYMSNVMKGIADESKELGIDAEDLIDAMESNPDVVNDIFKDNAIYWVRTANGSEFCATDKELCLAIDKKELEDNLSLWEKVAK